MFYLIYHHHPGDHGTRFPEQDTAQRGADRERWGMEEDEEEPRRVWLWVHPAGAKEALQEIRKACLLEGAPWVGLVEVCWGSGVEFSLLLLFSVPGI